VHLPPLKQVSAIAGHINQGFTQDFAEGGRILWASKSVEVHKADSM